MTQATNRPSTATLRTGSSQPYVDGDNLRGEQDLQDQVTDRVRAATSNPADAFAPTPDMSKVVTAWFDMAGDVMKLQQQFFATMLAAGNTDARTTTKL
jgi:hypothetical protein